MNGMKSIDLARDELLETIRYREIAKREVVDFE